ALSRLRADPAHLGRDGRARGQSAPDDRQGGGRAPHARPNAGAQQVRRGGDRRESAGEPGTQARAHSVRGADRHRAAVVRLLHQRRDDVSLLVRALSRQPAAAEIRVRRVADSHAGAEARPEKRPTRALRSKKGNAERSPTLATLKGSPYSGRLISSGETARW